MKHPSDLFWMKQAFKLASQAAQEGEVPVGALVVSETHQLIGQGWNKVRQTNDPTAHAEIIALREASSTLGNYRLPKARLYVTLEPCCMCAGALIHARIDRLIFSVRDFKAGAAGSIYNLLRGYPLNHTIQIDEGFYQKECSALLTDFFSARR